jgi:predicted esterase
MASSHPTPVASDFPASLKPNIHIPPNNTPTNVILFLPGLGDTATNFSSLARALNLPDALAITLNPPFPLPYPLGPGDQWSEDLQVDTATGALDQDSPLTRAVEIVAHDVILEVLINKYRYRPDCIHLLGFGQGGSVAVSVPLHSSLAATYTLGSVISIGGYLPISTSSVRSSKNRTPILLLSGSRSPLASPESSQLRRVKSAFEFVTYHQWKKNDDSMPKNRDEVLPMMQFWGRSLKSRRGVPADAVEIG